MQRQLPRATLFPYTTLFRSVRAYGTGILDAAGAIDRRKLADLAFAAPDAARQLNALIHRSEEHTTELQSRLHLVCRLLLEKTNTTSKIRVTATCVTCPIPVH